jgi:hypothetical protein
MQKRVYNLFANSISETPHRNDTSRSCTRWRAARNKRNVHTSDNAYNASFYNIRHRANPSARGAIHFRRQLEEVLARAVNILVAIEGTLLAVQSLPGAALSDAF